MSAYFHLPCLVWACIRSRLLLLAILRSRSSVAVFFGMVCSSWVLISRNSTKRSFWRPLGDVSVKGVTASNIMASRCMVSSCMSWNPSAMTSCDAHAHAWHGPSIMSLPWRMALLALVIQAKGGTITIEQPASSILMRHPRCQWLLKRVRLWRQRFWMSGYGAPTPKRTWLWANKRSVCMFATPTLSKNRPPSGFRLVRHHTDKNNKKCFTGKKAELRKSGPHGWKTIMSHVYTNN